MQENTDPFDTTIAYQALTRLARHPFDLTIKGAITAERIHTMQASGAGLSLLYAFERVNDLIMKELFELAAERHALEQMQAMQNGEIVNIIHGYDSEKRAVQHTALRDVFDNNKPTTEIREAVKKELTKLKEFIQKVDTERRFSEMILIGIGGSELGPKALFQGLAFYQRTDRKVHFIGNIDPDDVALTLRAANLAETLVVVVSKSGTTLETATNEAFVRDAFIKEGLDPCKQFISVTMPNTPMDDPKRYLRCFHMWDSIGGRYSATSMVGGLLLSFGVGYDAFMELLRGAHDMDRIATLSDPRQNLPLLAALLGIWRRNFLNMPTVAVIPYTTVLSRFPAHLQQLDMESNGKRIDKEGRAVSFETSPIIWGEPGTNAQHSFYQSIHQGTTRVPIEFIAFATQQDSLDFEWKGTSSQEKLLANVMAQAVALATGQQNANPNKVFPGNTPSSLLMGKKLTPYTLGSLLAYYEHKVAFQGFIWGINSFDQEGVQLGKVLADRFITLYRAAHGKGEAEAFPMGESLLNFVQNVR